ncbi:MAG: hypothetical protein WD810_01620 [Solirubrobacterales bacterium]
MAAVLGGGRGAVSVETKRFADDRFDDIVLKLRERVERCQSKGLEAVGPPRLDLFATDARGLRLDRLFAGEPPEEGLRVLSTVAADDGTAQDFVPATDVESFVPGLKSTLWRLDPNIVWPSGEDPRVPLPPGMTRGRLAAFCERFVLETDATPMSGSLADPGLLEQALVARLRDQVGVDQYPNRANPIDVASRLLEVAGSLRTRTMRRLDFSEIAAECGLRVDRGRVTQAFPLDPRRLVSGVPVAGRLREALGTSRVVLEGPPGSGKSWCLEAEAQRLRGQGWIVARHYCFLAPGDPDVSQRVALEAMSANLIAELLDDHRLGELSGGLGGGLDALERLLGNAEEKLASSEEDAATRIALIVDGLDHVARVDPAPGTGAADPDDFADRLALLDLPGRVTLVVGSQSGPHLDVLRDRGATTVEVPRLELRHTGGLLARQGVLRAIRDHGASADHADAVVAVHRQSAGNPLYATFLGGEILRGLEADEPQLPSQRVDGITAAAGDLEEYFNHLMNTVEQATDGGLVAEHLALLDFALTRDEMVEILPAFGADRIDRVLSQLRPVLDEAGMQGGLRVHHESFRRFIVARLAAADRPLGPLMAPVIEWLQNRGLFADERAYRYLLPLLHRSQRDDDLLDLVGADFVSESVGALQPHVSVLANLRLAAAVAGDREGYPALVRLAELRTAMTVAYREKLGDIDLWAEGLIEVEGPDRLGDRLLFEGRPTWPRAAGLRICALVDRAGGDAPWIPYFDLREIPGPTSQMEEEVEGHDLDEMRGRLRGLGPAASVDRLAEYLDGRPDLTPTFLYGSASILGDLYGAAALSSTLAAAAGMTAEARGLFELRLAEVHAGAGASEPALAAGRRALSEGVAMWAFRRLLDVGLQGDELEGCPNPAEAAAGAIGTDHPDHEVVDRFLTAVLCAARRGESLGEVRCSLAGPGFYPAWLRFCCDLAGVEAGEGDIVSSLVELAEHTDPFVGKPRACDLYPIHNLCEESFRRAAALVAEDRWGTALGPLIDIADGTTTTLSGSPSGPLTSFDLIEILLPHAEKLPFDGAQRLLGSPPGEFYEFHAEMALYRARFEKRAGEDDGVAPLAEAGRYLSAYGFRKDVTVFGPIEALQAIDDAQLQAEVSARFARVRVLCHRAYVHSDGRETSRASSAWFEAFASHSPGAAADLLGRTLLEDKPIESWVNENALDALLAKAGEDELPALLHHLLCRGRPSAAVKPWLEVIERLLAEDRPRGIEAFQELAAAVDGAGETPAYATADVVRSFADRHGLEKPPLDELPDLRRGGGQGSNDSDFASPTTEIRSGPYFAGIDSKLDLLLAVRDRRIDDGEASVDPGEFAEELANSVKELLAGQERVEMVAAFCEAHPYLRAASEIVNAVADLLDDEPAVAAAIKVLAWTAVREGWEPFGGLKHGHLLTTAFALNADAASRQLARGIAQAMDDYDYGVGFTRRTVEALVLAGKQAQALECWDAALDVIEHRLPATRPERDPFAAPGPDLDSQETWLAFARLLGACLHLPEYEVRAAALGGIAELIEADPELAATAVEGLFVRDAAVTDLILATRLLELCDARGVVAGRLVDRLDGAGATSVLGLRQAALTLLARVGRGAPAADTPLPPRLDAEPIPADEVLIWERPHRRAESLSQMDDRLLGEVVGRYSSLFNANRRLTLSIIEQQSRVQFSRSDRWVPPLPIHRWESELLEIAVHETATGLAPRLPGGPESNAARLHDFFAADVAAAAARARSRELRPAELSPPSERADAVGEPAARAAGPFAGWLRLAMVEYEVREGESFSSGSESIVESGLWSGQAPDADLDTPFRSFSPRARWHGLPDSADLVDGPLAASWLDQHLVAFTQMLAPVPELSHLLELCAAPAPEPLDLLDPDGRPAAVLRHWRMRPYSYDYHPRLPTIAGSELLLRPDLVDRLREGRDLVEITRVRTKELSGPPES